MRIPVIETIAGNTLRVTWCSSGVIAGALGSALWSGSETLINSVAAVDSGNGFYYALHNVPRSGGWYVNEWVGQIGVNTYVSRQLVKSFRLEVD